MRRVDGWFFASFAAGRTGRGAKFPPQFGQTPPSLFSTQSLQNVHSKLHIMASEADGGRSLSQHSQPGRNSSMVHLSHTCATCAPKELRPAYRGLLLACGLWREQGERLLSRNGLLHVEGGEIAFARKRSFQE